MVPQASFPLHFLKYGLLIAHLLFFLIIQTIAQGDPDPDDNTAAPDANCTCGNPSSIYQLAGVAAFSNYAQYTFENGFPEGLQISDGGVDDMTNNTAALYNHYFTPSNVQISNDLLVLLVPGDQDTSPILCAEVSTAEDQILYASVRVNAILSGEPGVVNGLFFYHDDCQEIDIEYLPDTTSSSNTEGQAPGLQYTNQANSCDHDENTFAVVPITDNATADLHEYRVDWLPGVTNFYTDEQLTATFTDNVPTEAGEWIFNLWTNGDPGFSVGPPKNDAILFIDSIEMYYNTSLSSSTACSC